MTSIEKKPVIRPATQHEAIEFVLGYGRSVRCVPEAPSYGATVMDVDGRRRPIINMHWIDKKFLGDPTAKHAIYQSPFVTAMYSGEIPDGF